MKNFLLNIFILIIWEFHAICPNHSQFPVLPGSFPTFMTCSPKKIKGKNIHLFKTKFKAGCDSACL